MILRLPKKELRAGVPPWVLAGALGVLLPIFGVATFYNIYREKEFTTRLLLEKGAALIRSFEAGARSSMMGMTRGGFQLQRLLGETAQLPDIAHLIVTDASGRVLAHGDPNRLGERYGAGVDMAAAARSKTPQWRVVDGPGGVPVFEVYRRFEPSGPPAGLPRWPMMRRPPEGFEPPPEPPRVIFVGLDMSAVEEARRADVRNAVLTGAVLLVAGFAGITLILLAQSYRAARTRLTRIKVFSDHVVDNMPVGLVATDGDQRVAAFNRAAESLIGRPAAAVHGRPAEAVLPPELWSALRRSAAEGAAAVETTVECRLADGRRLPLEVSAGRLTAEDGRYGGSILLFKDLREIQALRGEIARSQRLAAVGRLAAGVAHEIRNPLSSIKGFATYFQERYREDPRDSQVAAVLIQEVDRLNRVVGQLLEFSRPVGLQPREVRIGRAVADALRLVDGPAAQKGIAVRTEVRDGDLAVRLDPDRLSQVLLNLCLNGLDAMAPGGELHVRAAPSADGRRLEIRVDDTGCGIPAEDLPKVFEPYFTTKPGGTGLGLSITRNIVEAMGGDIAVQSRPGAGTTFILRLPLAASAPEATHGGPGVL